ncbi:N,O-diacetylmuramidase [Leucoagaricus sp. SymC.cos]|nr:N,O-diacetylmuramidase [Leucoagaricus sp. SymC.cos]
MELLVLFAFVLSVIVFAVDGPKGIDVSSHQPTVDWNKVKSNGVQFAYVKATEGTGYKNPYFDSQYMGATKVRLIWGSYHFTLPDVSSGAIQANYFVSNGGGWSADGITLPGALDIEYSLSQLAMVAWIKDFSNTYHSKTSCYPIIYTTTDWWKTCTDNARGFQNNNPLWIAHPSSSIGELPAGYS